MAESIAARSKRATSPGAVDQIETAAFALAARAMNAAVGGVAQVIDEARAEMRRAAEKRLETVRDAQALREKIDALGANARTALAQSRDELARAAIADQLELEARLIALADAERIAANRESELEIEVASLYSGMKNLADRLGAAKNGDGPATPLAREADCLADALLRVTRALANCAPPEAAGASAPAFDAALRERLIEGRLAAAKARM